MTYQFLKRDSIFLQITRYILPLELYTLSLQDEIYFHNTYFVYVSCRYKGRIIYNTRYQENNAVQQVVAGGGVSGSASQASASTSSSGATAINGCSLVAGGDSAPLSR